MKAVTASLLAVFVASLAPHSVACWWPGQALRRYFGSGDATTAPPDTVEPYEANDVLNNATFPPTENMTTQMQETTALSLEPLTTTSGTDAMQTTSRPFEGDSLSTVAVGNAEITGKTTGTAVETTTKGFPATSSTPVSDPDENSVPAFESGTFGNSMDDSYTEDYSVAQETVVFSESSALTTSERTVADTSAPPLLMTGGNDAMQTGTRPFDDGSLLTVTVVNAEMTETTPETTETSAQATTKRTVDHTSAPPLLMTGGNDAGHSGLRPFADGGLVTVTVVNAEVAETTPETTETSAQATTKATVDDTPAPPLLLTGGNDAVQSGTRPFDDGGLVTVTVVNSEITETTPETTGTSAQATTTPLSDQDENSLPAFESETLGSSVDDSYTEDYSVAQETVIVSESSALATSESTAEDTSAPPLLMTGGNDAMQSGSRPFDDGSVLTVTMGNAEITDATPETTETATQGTKKDFVSASSSTSLFDSNENSVPASDSGTLGNTTYDSYAEDSAVSSESATSMTSERTMAVTPTPPPLMTSTVTDPVQFISGPSDGDNSVAVTAVNAGATPETTGTAAQVTMEGFATTSSSPLFDPDENSVPPLSSGTSGSSAYESNAEDYYVTQETLLSSDSAVSTTTEITMTDASGPSSPRTFATGTANAHTSTLAKDFQFDATMSVTTVDQLSSAGYENDDTSALSNEVIPDATLNVTTIGELTAAYVDDHSSTLASEPAKGVDTTGSPDAASTSDDETLSTAFPVTISDAGGPADDASNLVADADDSATQVTAPLAGVGSVTTEDASNLVPEADSKIQTTTLLAGVGSVTTEVASNLVADADDNATQRTSPLANVGSVTTEVESYLIVDADDSKAQTTAPLAELGSVTIEVASNLAAGADGNATQTELFPDHTSATTELPVKAFSETSGGENPSTTQAITVASAESSNDASGTTAATTANMTVTSFLHAPVTQANLVATAVTSISNSSPNATTEFSVTGPTTNSANAATLSPTSYYSVETSKVTPSSAPTSTTATVRAYGVSESPVGGTTPSNYVSSIKVETGSEGSSTKDLAKTGSSLILLSTVPGLQDDDVDDSTVTTTTSTTRRYKPVYVRRFTPWIITRSSSSLPATSTGPPTTSALTAARAQPEQDTLLKESSTVESVPRTNTAYQRRYQNYPSQQRTPTKSTASTKVRPLDTLLVVPESFFGRQSLFNRFGRPYCPGCDALLIKLPERFSIPRVPPYVYG